MSKDYSIWIEPVQDSDVLEFMPQVPGDFVLSIERAAEKLDFDSKTLRELAEGCLEQDAAMYVVGNFTSLVAEQMAKAANDAIEGAYGTLVQFYADAVT